MIEGQYSPVGFNIDESMSQPESNRNDSSKSTSSLRASVSKKLLFSSGVVRNGSQLKQRSSTFKTLNTTSIEDEDEDVQDEFIEASWRHDRSYGE